MSLYLGTTPIADGASTALLSGKADVDLSNVLSNIDYVVESYRNGADWYRLYKSGWIEQGGKITKSSSNTQVTFLKPFSSLDYTLVNGLKSDNSNTVSHRVVAVEYASSSVSYEHTSTTGFTCYAQTISAQDWYACGQSAQS